MRIRLILGAVLTLMGLVWVGQGIGLIPGSFMTGDATWTVIGAITMAIGLVLVMWGLRRERSAG